ncbi:MAG: hypothetical protein IPN68_13940 [Bacteroidetes bacterium]|nr:hypothetical protein [Bacteroidota bacterium]
MEKKKIIKPSKQDKKDAGLVEEPNVTLILSSKLTDEEKAVRNSLRRISINARRRAYRKKSAVTIIRNGRILKFIQTGKLNLLAQLRNFQLLLI